MRQYMFGSFIFFLNLIRFMIPIISSTFLIFFQTILIYSLMILIITDGIFPHLINIANLI